VAHTRINPRVAKLHRSYTVEAAAARLGTHKNTIRNWLKAGLEAIDDSRPIMIKGAVLQAFLQRRNNAAKRPCPPGTLFCLKCREPREPALGMVDFVERDGGAGNLKALCGTCSTVMHRRARRSAIGAILPGIAIQITRAPSRISE